MQRKALHKTHKHALKLHTNMAGPSHELLETYTHVVQIQSTCFHNCFNIARYRSHCLQTVPPFAREINTFQGFHPSAQVIILNTHNISAATRRLSTRRTPTAVHHVTHAKTSAANTPTNNYTSKTITEPLKINRLGEHTTENAAQKLNRTHVC